MAAGRPPANLVALQARVDQVALDLFADPGWNGPAPAVRVDPRVAAAHRALASVQEGNGVIRISPEVAAEPADYLRGTLAHEAGHIALGQQRSAHTGWALAIGIPLWALAIACCVIGVQNSATQQISLWFGLALVPALVALRLIVIPSRRSELAADRWSATLIGTDAVLRTLQHLDEQCGPLTRFAARLGMDTHPSPRRRAQRLRDKRLRRLRG
jgi:Zn-dependent protease with chaperone function